MDKKRIIPLLLFFLAALALAAWGYPILKGRYLEIDEEETATAPIEDPLGTEEMALPSENASEADTDEELASEESSDEEEAAKLEDEFLQITPADCAKNCSGFTESEDQEYCRQRCGLIPSGATTDSETACARLEDLPRDYCLKDLAISKKDSELCKDIEDKGIQKTCRNRFIEDMLDSSTAGGADF
ncbi:MAG TPA: hypothetical protein PKA31_03015, partial [Candidatus Moranbacteria bacterium]|nr:hypothetical protein [Candidatus Moranbacteria bacterium]